MSDRQVQFTNTIFKYPNLSVAKQGAFDPEVNFVEGTILMNWANTGWPNQCLGYQSVGIDFLEDMEAQGKKVYLILQGGVLDFHAFEKLNSDEPLTEGNPVVVAASQFARYEHRVLHMFEQFRAYIQETYLKYKCVLGVAIMLKGRGPGIRNDVDVLNAIQREKTRRDILRLRQYTKALRLDGRLKGKVEKLTSERYLETQAKKYQAKELETLRNRYIADALVQEEGAAPLTSKEIAARRKEATSSAKEDAKKNSMDRAVKEAREQIKEIKTQLGQAIDEAYPEEMQEEIYFPCDDFNALLGFDDHPQVTVFRLGAALRINQDKLFMVLDYQRQKPGEAARYEARQRNMDVVVNAGGSFYNQYFTMISPDQTQKGVRQCSAIEIGANFDRAQLAVRDYKNIAPAYYIGRVRKGGKIEGQAYLIQTGADGVKHMTVGLKCYEESTPTGGNKFKPVSLALGHPKEERKGKK